MNYLTEKQAIEKFGIDVETLNKWVLNNAIKQFDIKGNTLYSAEAEKVMAKGRAKPPTIVMLRKCLKIIKDRQGLVEPLFGTFTPRDEVEAIYRRVSGGDYTILNEICDGENSAKTSIVSVNDDWGIDWLPSANVLLKYNARDVAELDAIFVKYNLPTKQDPDTLVKLYACPSAKVENMTRAQLMAILTEFGIKYTKGWLKPQLVTLLVKHLLDKVDAVPTPEILDLPIGKWDVYLSKKTAAQLLNIIKDLGLECSPRMSIDFQLSLIKNYFKIKEASGDVNTELQLCNKCFTLKVKRSEFEYRADNKTYRAYCKNCDRGKRHCTINERDDDQLRTATIKALSRSAYGHTAEWNKNNPVKKQRRYDITEDYVGMLLRTQKDKCALSDIQLSFKPHSNFRASLARINIDSGFIKGNCHIICLELNNQKTITAKKLETLFTGSVSGPNIVSFDKDEPHNKVYRSDFTDDNERRKALYRTPRGFISVLISSKISKSEKRTVIDTGLSHKNNSRHECIFNPNDMEASIAIIKQILDRQEWRCAYSNYPLSTTPGDFQLSIERKDSTLGYTIDNTCLIIAELNSADRSAIKDTDEVGGAAMSKEKFTQLRNAYFKKYLEPFTDMI